MKKFNYIKTRSSSFALILALLLMPWQSVPAQEVSDHEITSAVHASLLIDDAVSANAIAVATNDGVVDLTGSVNNILAKDRAEEITAATVGVRAIINRISVDPTLVPPDDELEANVRNTWRADPAVYSWVLDATAEDGVLTLTGEVDSYAKKELAETIAKGVKGVIGINNNIDVEYETNRLDHEIKNEIRARLENDIRVSDVLIGVTVDDGAVELSGAVGSLSEKNRADSLSWVAGVESVDTDDLNIRWWARDEMRRTQAVINRSDSKIEKSVEVALAYDPRVSSFQLKVAVVDGVANLSGAVDNSAAKTAAEQTARNTVGVTTVKNYIAVQSDFPPDAELESRIATALENDSVVNRRSVNILAENGWVYLSGAVNTSAQKTRAKSVAQRQFGVLGVENNIKFEHTWNPKPDWEIRADVRNQLRWNAFVDASEVTVSAQDGIVTLTGTVGSLTEKNEAKKNAFQGGAKTVKNEIEVEYPYYGPYGPTYYGGPYSQGYWF